MSKHHYLPQFYLRGFTNEDGLFMIYLVKEQRFKQNGKLFSPASHFFLPDDNTIIQNGVKDDFLEENYSRTEGYVAKAIDKIKAVDQNFGLDKTEIILLQYFAAELFWRVPAHRNIIEEVNNIESLNKLGVAVISKKTLRPVSSKLSTSHFPGHDFLFRGILSLALLAVAVTLTPYGRTH